MSSEYNYVPFHGVAHIPDITAEEAEALCRSYLAWRCIQPRIISPKLHMSFIAVFHIEGVELGSGEGASGWVVGGRMPHRELSDDHIQTPIEALAVYAYFFPQWAKAEGKLKPDGSVPEFRIPPNWELLPFQPPIGDRDLAAVSGYLAWHLIGKNQEHLLNDDLREMCRKRGWLS